MVKVNVSRLDSGQITPTGGLYITSEFGIINQKGEYLLPSNYSRIKYYPEYEFYIGEHYVNHKESTDFFDKQLNHIHTVNGTIFSIISPEDKVLAIYNMWPEGSGVIDLNTGKDIIPLTKDAIIDEMHGFIRMSIPHYTSEVVGQVTINSTEKIYNSSGNLILDIGTVDWVYDIYPVNEDIFYMSESSGNYFISKEGKKELDPGIFISELLAPGLLGFGSQVDPSEEKSTYGVLNQEGILIPADYDQVFSVNQQWILARRGFDLLVYSLSGELVYQYADVSETYPGDSGFAYKDLSDMLYIFDQNLKEIGCAYTPSLKYFSQEGNLYYANVAGVGYLIMDINGIDPGEASTHRFTPVNHMDIRRFFGQSTVYFRIDDVKQRIDGEFELINNVYSDFTPVVHDGLDLAPLDAVLKLRGFSYHSIPSPDGFIQFRYLDRVANLYADTDIVSLGYYDPEKNDMVIEDLPLEGPFILVNGFYVLAPLPFLAEFLDLHMYWEDDGNGLIGLSTEPLEPSPDEIQRILADFDETVVYAPYSEFSFFDQFVSEIQYSLIGCWEWLITRFSIALYEKP